MKFKTTRKAIMEEYDNVRYCGYCEMQNLLRFHTPVAYASGRYGWNFDMYEIYGLVICTVYRNLPGKQLFDVGKYENAAVKIWENYDVSYIFGKVDTRKNRFTRGFTKISTVMKCINTRIARLQSFERTKICFVLGSRDKTKERGGNRNEKRRNVENRNYKVH